MAYNILGKDDENLRVTVTEGEITTINIQPASITITGSGAPVDSVNGYTGIVVLNTDDIAEGATNQYYTDARFSSALATKTTTDLTEGTNLYYTDARVDARLLAGVPDIHADQLQITGMPGHISWNPDDGTVDLPLNANVTLQLGQEETHLVRNESGVTLVNGAVVRVTGASGNRLTVTHADNLTEGTSSATIGVMTESVANNNAGYMTVSGLVRGLDTSAYAEGTALWLGTNGQFVASKPLTPAHLVQVGWVVRSHPTEGSIFVHIQNGLELEELHDVLITNPLDGDALVWDAANGYWKNSAVGGGGLETDPVFTASPAGTITNANIINWNTAHSWGDHSVAGYLSSVALNDVTDVVLTAPSVDQVLKYDGANWVNANAPAGYTDADVDTHLNTATATAGQVLSWTGTDYDWITGGAGGGATVLNDLTDVNIGTGEPLTDGDLLRYNGIAGEWQNTNLGITLAPTLTMLNNGVYADHMLAFKIDGTYSQPSYEVSVVNPDTTETVYTVIVNRPTTTPQQFRNQMPGFALIDGNGFCNLILPNQTGNYTVKVRVQDFGDLPSEPATLNFTANPVVVNPGLVSGRYVRWTATREQVSNSPGVAYMTDLAAGASQYSQVHDLAFFEAPAQAGNIHPSSPMTSANTPAPYVVDRSTVFINSATYEGWKAFDNSTGTYWWSYNSVLNGTDWVQLDMGSSVTIQSFRYYAASMTYFSHGWKLEVSDTGAFAGEQTEIFSIDGFIPINQYAPTPIG